MLTRMQLVADIERRIAAAEWPPGSRLPSTEELAREYRVSASTMYNVFQLLQAKGVVRSVQGSGRYVPGGLEDPSPNDTDAE